MFAGVAHETFGALPPVKNVELDAFISAIDSGV